MLWYLEEFVSISRMPGWVDGMGWQGKGCHGMGVGLGRGTPCGKSWKKKASCTNKSPRHHCGALLASAGQLVAPLGLLFAFFFITWGVLVPSWAKAPNKYENKTNN